MIGDEQQARLAVSVGERDHVQGPGTAAITLVQYGDYECPFSGRAHPFVKDLQSQLGDRLRYVFRNFPLTHVHPHAQHAAEAAEAAAAQGRFWAMYDYLFTHQRALDDDHLLMAAAAIGLDEGRFANDMEHHAQAERVRADVVGGQESGVRGTPTFFVNGVRLGSPSDLEVVGAAIEDALTPG